MKRRDFMKFFGAVPLVLSDFKLIGTNDQPFGYIKIDSSTCITRSSDLLADLYAGDHMIIGGRPSMGKTAVALNLLSDLALEKKYACAYFSLELTKEELMKRLLSMNAKLSKKQIDSGNLTTDEYVKLVKESQKVAASKIFIDDTAGLSVEEMRRRITKLKKSGTHVKYVFVDYFQLAGAEKTYDCRRDHVADILFQLKLLAQSQNITVISLAQLNRGVIGRSSHRPILDDLRETNRYENIDKAVLLYREDYQDSSVENCQIEMIIDKNKNQKKYSVVATIDKNSSKLSDFKII